MVKSLYSKHGLTLIITLAFLLLFTSTIQPFKMLKADEEPHPVANAGFEDGLTGWTTSGDVTIFSATEANPYNIVNNPSFGVTEIEPDGTPAQEWSIGPADGSMVRVRPSGANTGVDPVATILGLSQDSIDYIKGVYTNITNTGYIYRDVELEEGQVFSISWQYIAGDYFPFNDASFVSMVRVADIDSVTKASPPSDKLPIVDGVRAQVSVLGSTNPGTANYTTGSYGATGWQTTEFVASDAGTYRFGFVVFNLGDTSLAPYLYVDDKPGVTLRNGVNFPPIARDPKAPAPAGANVFAPNQPTNISAVAGSGIAMITFKPPGFKGAAPISKYIVEASPGGLIMEGSSTTIVFPGLTNGTSYTFTVKAVNSFGESPESAVSNPVTPKATVIPPTETVMSGGDDDADNGTGSGTGSGVDSGTGTGTDSGTGNGTGTGTGVSSGTTQAQVQILRTISPDGSKSDNINFSTDDAVKNVQRALEAGGTNVQMVLRDPDGTQRDARVALRSDALKAMADNGLNLEIKSDYGSINIPPSSLAGVEADLFFRMTPSKPKTEQESKTIKQDIQRDLQESIGGVQAEIIGNPFEITTNVRNLNTTIILPLAESALPADPTDRAAFLNDLAIFIQHSDGDRVLIRPEIVPYRTGYIGLSVNISKFSTFTIVRADFKPYVTGYPDGTFRPNAAITRAEIATMINRLSDLSDFSATRRFADVPTSHWAFANISRVSMKSWVIGYTDGTFQPNQSITRAELATLLSRIKRLNGSGTPEITDISGHWAQSVIEQVVREGIMEADGGEFRPDAVATRAEVIVAMNRTYGRQALNRATPTFADVPQTFRYYAEIEAAVQ